MLFIFKDGKTEAYSNVVRILKPASLPVHLKPVGILFIRLLNFIAIPLVIASLFVGAASLGNIRRIARIGTKTLVYFLSTTAIAIAIGILLANTIKPGERLSVESKQKLMQEFAIDVAKIEEKAAQSSVVDFFVNIVPTNPFNALASGDMLSIVFLAVFLGLIAALIEQEKAKIVIKFFDSFTEIMIRAVGIVMLLAPYAVFVLIAAIISEFGFGILQTLIWYVITVIAGLCFHMLIIYPLYLKIFSKMPIHRFFKGIRPAQLVAFSTSSSAATLPVNMECCEKNLGVPRGITSFVLPLGATINMDGTALYQGVATVFIAQIYGQGLGIAGQLTILLTATLASIGTAPVPGVGIIMLVIVLRSVNVPEEGIALIIGVDRLLDMCRTVSNITGDAVGSVIIASSEKVLDFEDTIHHKDLN
ncbi:MAG: hypothetical protein A2Y62_09780 [Candidatus Fischerbacteria bacterium RBG_13_37_8]|uniref:Dicarboxylate/amino acid:cation symporter n=1 Tax=Candidatus Fischerbacteria bacterium RBG_13_37_8 TaxID=1817863 RepID=A0A1F5V620_9BACT|nr:MAG: hypothetical protein A2Y62_09780 [Candidatus Fischerbacteria bacterium RBG_13_37_8]